ncbi:flagellar biosynthetic protein FlhB [Desulfosarcina alkanivorans]|uniref:Flagellar biosynthetic protein FlhB n=1 Tax=Desulfosarcina alkanivorans TaxID=571177 RepID=A0A5K7YDV1_9BACT|nr:EscU/YscU/HrcU family type III secretion system export apparatus switch protein [Desulfosarcina alkanivorans]BBO66823.1 flagellar biosynthetic protein FlhB [Desulfosarcina alkanivorans]
MNEQRSKRAAALKYDQAGKMAPRVVAKGKGRIAEQIIQVARENNVPLHEDPNLANVLEAMELESEIPAELYRAVAEVLVFIYRLNGKLRS